VGQHSSASATRLLGLDGCEVLAAEVVGGEWQLDVQTTATEPLDLPITRRNVAVGYVRARRILAGQDGRAFDLIGSRWVQSDRRDDQTDDHGAFDSWSNGTARHRPDATVKVVVRG
jgi:hypothetical protein